MIHNATTLTALTYTSASDYTPGDTIPIIGQFCRHCNGTTLEVRITQEDGVNIGSLCCNDCDNISTS